MDAELQNNGRSERFGDYGAVALVYSLPEDIRVWVKERKPKTTVEAGELADDYAQARKSNVKGAQQLKNKREERQTQPLRCHSCGKVEHIARDCRMGVKPRDHV